MDLSRHFAAPGQNRILSSVPLDVQLRVLSGFERVSVSSRQLLHQAGFPIVYVYFPLSAVMSLAVPMNGGACVEIATIGNEGMTGIPVSFGAAASPCTIYTQIPGQAVRMRADAFLRAIEAHRELGSLVRRYSHVLFRQVAQNTACNRVHSVRQRLCRGLLTAHDRVGSDEFHLTQELLGYMLGVRRPSITLAAFALQKAGFIRYRHGKMRLIDRAGLEAAACECYERTRQALDEFAGLRP